MVTPEASRIAIFRSGTSMGSRRWIPTRGHCPPSSGVGARFEWKNAQKNPRKKKASDVMNRTMPYQRPFWTVGVYIYPITDDSSSIVLRETRSVLTVILRACVFALAYGEGGAVTLDLIPLRSYALPLK